MKTLKQWLPQMTVGIIVMSFLNLHFYYGAFGIQIQNYVEISEIIFSLTVFISSAIYIAFISLGILLFHKTDTSAVEAKNRIDTQNKTYTYFSTHSKKSLHWFKWFFDRFTISWYILSVILIVLTWAAYIGFSDQELLKSAGDFDMLYLFFNIYLCAYVMFLSTWYKRKLHPDLTDFYRFVFTVLIGVAIFIGHRSNKSALLVKRGYPKFEVHLITDSKHYVTNDTVVYVGATKNFYFLYDCKANVSTVIPSDDVKEAQFRRLRDGL